MNIDDIVEDAVIAWPMRDVLVLDEEGRVSAIVNPHSSEVLLMQPDPFRGMRYDTLEDAEKARKSYLRDRKPNKITAKRSNEDGRF